MTGSKHAMLKGLRSASTLLKLPQRCRAKLRAEAALLPEHTVPQAGMCLPLPSKLPQAQHQSAMFMALNCSCKMHVEVRVPWCLICWVAGIVHFHIEAHGHDAGCSLSVSICLLQRLPQ